MISILEKTHSRCLPLKFEVDFYTFFPKEQQMVILLSVCSLEVRKKANTRNLLHFQVSCTRANLPYANLFKYCSYNFHLRCYQRGGRSCGFCCLCTDQAEWGLFSGSPGASIDPQNFIFFFSSLSNLLFYPLFILSPSRTKYPNIRVEISFCVLLCCLFCKISNAGQKDLSNYQPFSRVDIPDIIFKV